MLGGTATTPGQPLGTPTKVQPGSAAAAVTQRVGPLAATGTPVTPTAITAVRVLTLNAFVFNLSKPTIFILRYFCVLNLIHTVSLICTFKRILHFVCMCLQETLENVKKCRNFLSTLIKLASSGKQSSETTANVKELVKSLLVCFLSLSLHTPSLC